MADIINARFLPMKSLAKPQRVAAIVAKNTHDAVIKAC